MKVSSPLAQGVQFPFAWKTQDCISLVGAELVMTSRENGAKQIRVELSGLDQS